MVFDFDYHQELVTKTCNIKTIYVFTVHVLVVNAVTGCAVAQHCYNGDVSFLWEKWKL